jgi:hypothetical protein
MCTRQNKGLEDNRKYELYELRIDIFDNVKLDKCTSDASSQLKIKKIIYLRITDLSVDFTCWIMCC